MSPTMIDLFAGCGGMTAGFVGDGFTPVLAVEHNLYAASTYAANFGEHHTVWGDVAEVDDAAIPSADVVIGGPPCQGFSNLGSKNVDDPRNQLWKEFLRFVQVARPQVFVIENVDRFRASSEFGLLLEQADHGMIAEYELIHGLLLAADYGVPQRRARTIVIGSRVGRIGLPAPTHAGAAGTWRTVREAIGGLPERPDTTELPQTRVEYFGRAVPGTYKWLDLHFGRRPRELSLRRYDCVPPGGGRFDLPEELLPRCWREKPTGTTDVMGRMRWDAPSPAPTCPTSTPRPRSPWPADCCADTQPRGERARRKIVTVHAGHRGAAVGLSAVPLAFLVAKYLFDDKRS